MSDFRIHARTIPVADYRHLRNICGLSEKSEIASKIGLNNSLYSVVVENDDEIIGMGRIIGDGGCFCQIVDICVDPAFQGRGLGRKIMVWLMDFIEEELPETCYISLIADGKASSLYAQFGFQETMPEGKGMYYRR